jgi:glycosyltransferase involved in cell wall biosynthesis
VTPCRWYADFMADYLGLPRSAMHVVYPGLNLDGFPVTPKSDVGTPLRIGYLARIAPEKGLHQLVEALTLLAKDGAVPAWRFEAAGFLAPHRRAYLQEQQQAAERGGWRDRFHYVGEPDHAGKIAFLSGLDLFSAPTTYREPKGLYVLEALACGVPVVQPQHGSFPELVELTGGGVLVAPGDPAALAARLAELLRDTGRRRQLGAAGQAAVRSRFTAEQMAQATATVLARYLP